MITATSDQITWLENTLTAHELYAGDYDRLWSALEAHRIDERTPGDGSRIAYDHAEEIIAWVRRQTGQAPPRIGCAHRADRNGNCIGCGAELTDPSLMTVTR